MLKDKRLLITGVATPDSIAYAVAHRALEFGAEVVLSAFPRDLELARQTAAGLPQPVDVLPLDLTSNEEVEAITAELGRRWDRLDGAVHAVAFAPRDALAGDFLTASAAGIELAFRTSAASLASLARINAALAPASGASIVGLDFDAGGGAWPIYNWMGVCKAALQSVCRYLARDLGPRRIRVNLVASGPLRTRAGLGIPGFDQLLQAWEARSPIAWDPNDAGPVAGPVCFLLSDLAQAVTGEILHADGGYHAMAAALDPARRPTP